MYFIQNIHYIILKNIFRYRYKVEKNPPLIEKKHIRTRLSSIFDAFSELPQTTPTTTTI